MATTEAPSAPAAARPRRTNDALREALSKYGLLAALAALPIYFGIHDLAGDQGNLSRLGENLIRGLSNGSIWALIAVGYTLVYGIIELINFAHGDVFMIGAFTAFSFTGTLGLTLTSGSLGLVFGLLATLIITMMVTGSLNVMIERVAYRPLRGLRSSRPSSPRSGSRSSCRTSASCGAAAARRASRTSSSTTTRSSRSSGCRSTTATSWPSVSRCRS